MKAPSYRCVTLLFVLAFQATAWSATLSVPGDSPTIQGAIDLAADGDTIEVAPGTYVENIDFLNKSLVVRSLDGPEVTVIDGSAETQGPVRRSTVVLNEGSGTNPTLEGFTVTGGMGTSVNGLRFGGGIYCLGSGAVINCIVDQNNAIRGGGMAAREITGLLRIVDSSFTRHVNIAEATGGTAGGGLLAEGTGELEMSGCEFRFNEATVGGGAQTSLAVMSISNTMFRQNVAGPVSSFGGGLALGPINLPDSPGDTVASLQDCQFLDNRAEFAGGGIVMLRTDLQSERTTFRGNQAQTAPAVLSDSSTLRLSYCLIYDNTATDGLVIVAGINPSRLFLDHCTIANNDCPQGIYFQGGDTTSPQPRTIQVTNTIVQQNSNSEWFVDPITDELYSHSNLEGFDPSSGVGVIDEDPLFVNAAQGDFRLQPGSPCIDTGDPAFPLDADGSPTDMGALPFDGIGTQFIRGDANQDGTVNLGDAIRILDVALLGLGLFLCDSAADSNFDDRVDTGDAITLFSFLFSGGPAPAAPFPDCGTSTDILSCLSPAGCP